MIRKIIVSFCCFAVIFAFTACNSVSDNPNNKESKTGLTSSQSIISDDTSLIEELLDYKEIEKIYLEYEGTEVDLDFDEQMIRSLQELCISNDVPEATLNEQVATINIKYKKRNDPNLFAKIYIGSDSAYYLKWINHGNKNAAVKIADEFFNSKKDLFK